MAGDRLCVDRLERGMGHCEIIKILPGACRLDLDRFLARGIMRRQHTSLEGSGAAI